MTQDVNSRKVYAAPNKEPTMGRQSTEHETAEGEQESNFMPTNRPNIDPQHLNCQWIKLLRHLRIWAGDGPLTLKQQKQLDLLMKNDKLRKEGKLNKKRKYKENKNDIIRKVKKLRNILNKTAIKKNNAIKAARKHTTTKKSQIRK